ncbi:hypothetical protein [Pseudomonas glycinae]|uniref:Uncharacterized protein n=1 Tax=Pseudomonas glycinae TaxID=1785145 RepID=A0ABN5FPX8_9PSED|nr:hypothetical protein [Pseudomonas glycinae]AUG97401.1 hypothetical protein AWU82_28370 [Pseudomonas glycinae]
MKVETLVRNAATARATLTTIDVGWWKLSTFVDHLQHTCLPARTLQVAYNPSWQLDNPARNAQPARAPPTP